MVFNLKKNQMSQESETKECHIFIESKSQIEKVLYRLSSIENT